MGRKGPAASRATWNPRQGQGQEIFQATDALLALPLPERIEIFERSPFEQWLVLFDESYPATSSTSSWT